MIEAISSNVLELLKDAARKLSGPPKRNFMARTTLEVFGGSARKAQTHFGWNRETVTLGLHELRTGITCVDNYRARGNKKTEVKVPTLEQDIRALLDPISHADPQLRSTLRYTRVSAQAVRRTLIAEKGYDEDRLPTARTISTILNRMGYRLRAVQKSKPKKSS